MTPKGIEEGYGWIEPADQEEGRETRAVQRFWEKPALAQTRTLLARGAVWNTFVCIAQATTLWEMTQQTAPDLHHTFSSIRLMLSSSHASLFTEHVYQIMRSVNFSSAICEPLASRLRVLPVPEVGWSDWGSRERIFSSLQQMGRLEEVLARLRHRGGKTALALPRMKPRPPSLSLH